MCDKGFYAITRLHRTDIEEVIGKEKADLILEEDIPHIARKMGDYYVGHGGFWDDLKWLLEDWYDWEEMTEEASDESV